jgi:hypothetical protein
MATVNKRLKRIADDLLETLADYPNEARDEVISELMEITVREEELTYAERAVIETLIWAHS